MRVAARRSSRALRQSRWSRLAERARLSWERLFTRGDIAALLVALGILLLPALSLWAADWPLDMGIVLPILVLSLGFGFLLARSQYNELLALMMSMIYSVTFVLLVAALNQPGGLRSGAYEVFSRVALWGVAAANAGVNPDDLVFTMLVATLFWFLGYNITWHLFRVDRMFRVVLPPGLILLTNTVYYNGEADLRPYVVVFLFLSLLLAVRSHMDAQEWDWYMDGLRVPRRVRWQVNLVGAVLALLVVAGSWSIPSGDLQQRLDRFQEFMQADPFRQMSEVWNRLFNTVDAYGPVTADYYGGDSLALSGAIQLGDQVVMQVRAPNNRRYYWRSRVYDTYDQGNWTSQAMKRVPYLDPPFAIVTEAEADAARVAVEQQFTIGLSASRLMYTAPQPAAVSVPVRADLRFLDPAETVANLYVVRPFRILERNDTYTATSLVSTATAAQLNAAATTYPAWVQQTQLYVPPSVTGRTLALAQEIVTQAGAVTPYEKTKAVERWLRANISYNETIPQPPVGQDPIDWLLFDIREGYCNYYASAMVMMLRSQGVPARMAAGFAQGEWDGAQYIVRERDAHTWVEVYFPGYGWIEFEPTAAQAPLSRGDEETPSAPTPTPQATATPTLTPTVTPTFTPTPTQDATLAPPENEALSPPTGTPTLTPTPTATPVIIPTQAPPLPNTSRSPVAFILPAILTALAVLLVLVLVVAVVVFIWWWYEWRGTAGFTPARRNYTRLERYVLNLLRLPLNPQETPNERQGRIIETLPRRAARPIAAITHLYMAERYGRPGTPPPSPEQAERAWQHTRRNILVHWLRRVFPPARWFLQERE